MRRASLFLAAFAAVVLVTPASAKILITVDKSAQEMTVAVDGVTRWTWPVSTGRPSYDTPSGTHTAFRMEKEHFSKEWDDAPMPYSIFFTKQGHAIHGSYARIGNPASHGCVRLAPANAAKLFALVEQQGVTNTKVVLTGDVRVAMARATPRTAAVGSPRPAAQPLALQPAAAAAQARYEPLQTETEPQYGYRQPQYGYQPQPVYQNQPVYQQQPAYPQQPFRPLFPFFR